MGRTGVKQNPCIKTTNEECTFHNIFLCLCVCICAVDSMQLCPLIWPILSLLLPSLLCIPILLLRTLILLLLLRRPILLLRCLLL